MKVGRILSMFVVLTMVMAAMPGLYLTASAETVEQKIAFTPSASSSIENYGWTLGNSVDGNVTSSGGSNGWASSNDAARLYTDHDEWYMLDFGENKATVNRLDLYPRTDSGNEGKGFPIDFRIEWSDDNSSWTTLETVTGHKIPADIGANSFTFDDDITCRYLRIYATHLDAIGGKEYFMQFAEVEAYYVHDETTPNDLIGNADYVFDGSSANGLIDGNGNIDINTISSPSHWTGWQSSWHEGDLQYGDDQNPDGVGVTINAHNDGGVNYIQIYGTKVPLEKFGSITASEAVQKGTADRDFIIVEWQPGYGGNGAEYDYGFYDSEGNIFDSFRQIGGDNSRLGPFYAGASTFVDQFGYSQDTQGFWTEIKDPIVRIVYENNPNGGYTATYYGGNNGKFTKYITKVFTEGNVKDFSEIKTGRVANNGNATEHWHTSQIKELKIYAGDYPAEEDAALNLEAELGWDGEGFTINFIGAQAGDKIELTRGDKTDVYELAEGQEGIAVATDATNAVYSAVSVRKTAEGNKKSAKAAQASLYELLAADLVANKEFYTADAVDKIRVNKANEIIARGGIYTGANAGFEGLMTVSVNDNTVTAEIDETIYGLGIGFVLDGNTIYFGSDEGTAVDTNGANGRYRKLVIKDGKVTLEDSVTQEAVVLSLESVNIEFIETAVAEKEAAEDAVFEPDFIPVL